jgi:hypothetical protein
LFVLFFNYFILFSFVYYLLIVYFIIIYLFVCLFIYLFVYLFIVFFFLCLYACLAAPEEELMQITADCTDSRFFVSVFLLHYSRHYVCSDEASPLNLFKGQVVQALIERDEDGNLLGNHHAT